MDEPENHGSFVARIWLEHSTDQSPIWRGHVRQVHGEQECYFQDFSTMQVFLERVSGVPLPPGSANDGKDG